MAVLKIHAAQTMSALGTTPLTQACDCGPESELISARRDDTPPRVLRRTGGRLRQSRWTKADAGGLRLAFGYAEHIQLSEDAPVTAARPSDAGAAGSSEPLVAPFHGWLVKPEWAERVISRSHDSLTRAERRAITAANPFSYANVTRSSEDLASGEDFSLRKLIEHGAGALTRLLEASVFAPTGRRCVYLYRMTHELGAQTGVVCAVALQGLSDGRILFHENIKEPHAALLTEHLRGVGAASNPVALAAKTGRDLSDAIDEVTAAARPELVFGASSVCHEIWIAPEDSTERLLRPLAGEVLYVTDGHHRLAAAQRAQAVEPCSRVMARTLAAVYPAHQMHVHAFHRTAVDRRTNRPEQLAAALAGAVEDLTPVPSAELARPRRRGQVGVYVGGSGDWYLMTLPKPTAATAAVDALDVELLRRCVIGPVLGTDELSGRGLVDYLPEPAGLAELVRRCDNENRVGFVMHPVSVGELTAVADENGRMPPKSSFFYPKPRSGAIMYMLGRGATAALPPS